MGSLCFLNPEDGMTLSDQKDYRQNAIAAGLERAFDKKLGAETDVPGLPGVADHQQRTLIILNWIKAGNWPKSIDCREFQPTLDAGAGNDFWETFALLLRGAAYSVFNGAAAPTLAANKLTVIWKVGCEAAPFPISRLIIRTGGAAGNILGIFDLEQIINELRPVGYLSEPVIIDPTITFAVQVLCRVATLALTQVQLGAFIFEPSGQTIA